MAKTTSSQTTREPPSRSPALLAARLRELVQAAFTGLWIQTYEPTEAIRDLTTLCRAESWRLGTWDCDRGMTFPLEPVQIPGVTDTQDPLAVIRALPQIAQGSGTTLVAFESLHRFLGATEIVQALARQIHAGKTARVFGSLLTWLNDHESDVFFVGTCNDASKLPPEFARAERFDGVFFVDLPGRDQKDSIWGIYTRHYGLDAKQARPDDANWTGAEIKSCCRLASLLDVPLVQAAQNVVQVAVTAGDKIEGLRQWASGRCLSADRAGVYSRSEGMIGGRVRRVVRAD